MTTRIKVTIEEGGHYHDGTYEITSMAVAVNDPFLDLKVVEHGLQHAIQQAFQSYQMSKMPQMPHVHGPDCGHAEEPEEIVI